MRGYYMVMASCFDKMADMVVFAPDKLNAVARMIEVMVKNEDFHNGWDFSVVDVKIDDDGEFYWQDGNQWRLVPRKGKYKHFDPPILGI